MEMLLRDTFTRRELLFNKYKKRGFNHVFTLGRSLTRIDAPQYKWIRSTTKFVIIDLCSSSLSLRWISLFIGSMSKCVMDFSYIYGILEIFATPKSSGAAGSP